MPLQNGRLIRAFSEGAADGTADGIGGDAVDGVGDPLADALLGGLVAGGGGEADAREDGFVGDAVEGDAEGGASPGGEGGLDFDQAAVDGAGEGSEEEVDALEGELAVGLGEAAAGDVFSEDDGRGRLALDAGREEMLGDDFGSGTGEATDEAGESAFGDAARTWGGGHGG